MKEEKNILESLKSKPIDYPDMDFYALLSARIIDEQTVNKAKNPFIRSMVWRWATAAAIIASIGFFTFFSLNNIHQTNSDFILSAVPKEDIQLYVEETSFGTEIVFVDEEESSLGLSLENVDASVVANYLEEDVLLADLNW